MDMVAQKRRCRSVVRIDFDPGEKHGGREDMPRFSSTERYNTKEHDHYTSQLNGQRGQRTSE